MMTLAKALLACVGLFGVAGCGEDAAMPPADAGRADGARDGAVDGNAPADATLDSRPTDAAVDAPTSDAEADAAQIDAATDADVRDAMADAASDDCADEVAALATNLDISTRACTIAVRLDYEDFSVIGYRAFCGAYASVDEATARERAQADTGTGTGATLLGTGTADDMWVFYDSPGDFGGASAVSGATGLTVFGGTIVWDGGGNITYPATFRPASELGRNCSPTGTIPTARGWDLRSGTALPEADVSAAIEVVRRTAAPGALWVGGYVFNGVVLLYPRTVGAFDPTSAEWIVLVNGGWLE